MYGLLSADEVYKSEWETEVGRADSLTVNSLWNLHRINGVKLDRQ